MDFKKTGAGIVAGTALVFGGVDAAVLKEQPLERVEMIADERVEARQIEDRVETTFPWKDQNGLKVVVDLGNPTIGERLADKRNKEVITEVVDFGEGGFKVDILLNEKPDTNRFCYAIEGAEDYDFFYQPPLTEDEIAEGAERPEEIVGSYAVYHKELKNHRVGSENYATGKVMHIPRPQVWELNDEENTKEWAELSYEGGELCVTARQEFIDEAEYPVRIDPTFGYTSLGASETQIQADRHHGRIGTVVGNGVIDSVSFGVRKDTNNRNFQGAVYDSGLSLLSPQSGAVSITSTVMQFRTANISSGPTVSAGTYYAAVLVDAAATTNSVYRAYDAGGVSGDSITTTGVYPTWRNPFATVTNETDIFSIYATYTAAASSNRRIIITQ